MRPISASQTSKQSQSIPQVLRNMPAVVTDTLDVPSRIMRIASLIPLYSIFSFLSICFPNAFVYLVPWASLFQALALGSFFLLMCEFVSPNSTQRDVFFAALELPSKNGTTRPLGLRWFKVGVAVSCLLQSPSLIRLLRLNLSWSSSIPSFLSSHLWLRTSRKLQTFIACIAANLTLPTSG